MAKASVQVKCSKCGKDFMVEKKCYNRDDANRFEEWVASQDDHLCRECYAEEMRAQREVARAAEAAKNAEAAQACTLQLPELTGSEKQIKWATDIRTRLIANMTKRGIKWDVIASGQFPEQHKAEIEAEIAKLMELSAKSWIEMRGKKIFGLSVD